MFSQKHLSLEWNEGHIHMGELLQKKQAGPRSCGRLDLHIGQGDALAWLLIHFVCMECKHGISDLANMNSSTCSWDFVKPWIHPWAVHRLRWFESCFAYILMLNSDFKRLMSLIHLLQLVSTTQTKFKCRFIRWHFIKLKRYGAERF